MADDVKKTEMDESERRIFDPFKGSGWAGLIILRAGSFDGLKSIASEIVDSVRRAKGFRDLPIAGGGNSGSAESAVGYNCLFTSPIQLRIIELRRQADELEKSLGGEMTVARI